MRPATITFKDSSVRAAQIDARIFTALAKVAGILGEWVPEIVVTSLDDSKHRPGSEHYNGRAVDVRSKTLPGDADLEARKAMALSLGPDFRVILEDRQTQNEHFHIELEVP